MPTWLTVTLIALGLILMVPAYCLFLGLMLLAARDVVRECRKPQPPLDT